VEAGNQVLLQMMDTDDPGLAGDFIDVSMYETMEDQYIPGRDLTAADPMKDLFVYIQDSDLTGNLFNSSTNLCEKASKEKPAGIPKRPGIVPPGRLAGSIPSADGPELPPSADGEQPVGMPAPEPLRPKNLEVTLDSATLKGAISAAKQHYRPGVTYIDETTREELCNVTQTPAPAINNGVIVVLKNHAVWTAAGTSYLTALTIGPDCALVGRLLVDGQEIAAAPGTYTGALTVTER
jgi:hypothetical protein